MAESQLFIHSVAAESQIASDLADRLLKAMSKTLGNIDVPTVECRSGFDHLPTASELGPFSLVVVLLPPPGQAFNTDEVAALQSFLDVYGASDVRLIPVALEQPRNVPPAPLGDLKSFALHDPTDTTLIANLTTRLLNIMYLRVSSERRKIFLSYRFADGRELAPRMEKFLKHLGYEVWRDESTDRDLVTSIPPGSSAQEIIRSSILKHGFVLVLDTMQAPESTWVQEEINLAISYMLPMLPIVVLEQSGPPHLDPAPRKLGGRFRPLAEAQHEVRLSVNGPPGHDRLQVENAIDNDDWTNAALVAFGLELENKIRDRLLANLKARRELISETKERLAALNFKNWSELSAPHLLYAADRSLDDGNHPELKFRLLIQCAPYDSILDRTVDNLCQRFRESDRPYQYAILVHRTVAYVADKRRLLQNRGGHVLIIRPDQLTALPSLVKFA